MFAGFRSACFRVGKLFRVSVGNLLKFYWFLGEVFCFEVVFISVCVVIVRVEFFVNDEKLSTSL